MIPYIKIPAETFDSYDDEKRQDNFQSEMIKTTKKVFERTKKMIPQMNVLCKKLGKHSIHVFGGIFFVGKDAFYKHLASQLLKKLSKKGYEILCVCIVAEVTITKGEDMSKRDGLVVTFETLNSVEGIEYEVTEERSLVQLEKSDERQGQMVEVLKNYNETRKTTTFSTN